MHYLKCDQCGHLNEAKTEYLTFCTACNKRIPKTIFLPGNSEPGPQL